VGREEGGRVWDLKRCCWWREEKSRKEKVVVCE